jgi:hypothetical protein
MFPPPDPECLPPDPEPPELSSRCCPVAADADAAVAVGDMDDAAASGATTIGAGVSAGPAPTDAEPAPCARVAGTGCEDVAAATGRREASGRWRSGRRGGASPLATDSGSDEIPIRWLAS